MPVFRESRGNGLSLNRNTPTTPALIPQFPAPPQLLAQKKKSEIVQNEYESEKVVKVLPQQQSQQQRELARELRELPVGLLELSDELFENMNAN